MTTTTRERIGAPRLDEVHGAYRLRFAASDGDREAAFRLRFEVFNRELGEGLAASEATGLDRDEFDAQCDHLLVEERRSGRIIGTYRMQVGEMAPAGVGFYSATEFELAHLPAGMLDQTAELGRACVERAHRNKMVLFLLWRGLAGYVLWKGRRYMLGCSSLTSQDPAEGRDAYEQLARAGHLRADFSVPPRSGYECRAVERAKSTPTVTIPKLFAAYLRHGAKICGPPAIDRAFGTIDFLTLFDIADFDPRLFAAFTAGLERAQA